MHDTLSSGSTPTPGSYTPITNLVNKKGPSVLTNRVALVLMALLLVTAPVIGYNLYQAQTRTGQAITIGPGRPETCVHSEPLCGQAIPYCIAPPGSQLGPNQCKKKSPTCYECRHSSGRIEFFGCCGQQTPTPTVAIPFTTPVKQIPTPTKYIPTATPTPTPTPTPPQECPLPSIHVTISCPTCDIFTDE